MINLLHTLQVPRQQYSFLCHHRASFNIVQSRDQFEMSLHGIAAGYCFDKYFHIINTMYQQTGGYNYMDIIGYILFPFGIGLIEKNTAASRDTKQYVFYIFTFLNVPGTEFYEYPNCTHTLFQQSLDTQ